MQGNAQPHHAAFAQLAAKGADARRIAHLSASTWRDIDAALSPIVGPRGVAALFNRSLFVTSAHYPCLTAVRESDSPPGEFATLQATLAQQTTSNAASASDALLQTFKQLLTKLIGGSLTERLLESVLNNLSCGSAVQDISS